MNRVSQQLELLSRERKQQHDTAYMELGVISPDEVVTAQRRKRARQWHRAYVARDDERIPVGMTCALAGRARVFPPGDLFPVIVPLTRRGEIRAAARRRKQTRGWS